LRLYQKTGGRHTASRYGIVLGTHPSLKCHYRQSRHLLLWKRLVICSSAISKIPEFSPQTGYGERKTAISAIGVFDFCPDYGWLTWDVQTDFFSVRREWE
jgi:hypothetical protein